ALALTEEKAVTLIGFGGRTKSGVLPHRPETPAIHRRINSASVRKFTRISDRVFRIGSGEIFLGVQAIDRETRERGEVVFTLFVLRGALGTIALVVRNGSEFSGAAKRRDGEKEEENYDARSQRDQPGSHIAGPGTQDGVEPCQCQDSENRADGFVEELLQGSPEAAEARLRHLGYTSGSGHECSLAQMR